MYKSTTASSTSPCLWSWTTLPKVRMLRPYNFWSLRTTRPRGVNKQAINKTTSFSLYSTTDVRTSQSKKYSAVSSVVRREELNQCNNNRPPILYMNDTIDRLEYHVCTHTYTCTRSDDHRSWLGVGVGRHQDVRGVCRTGWRSVCMRPALLPI